MIVKMNYKQIMSGIFITIVGGVFIVVIEQYIIIPKKNDIKLANHIIGSWVENNWPPFYLRFKKNNIVIIKAPLLTCEINEYPFDISNNKLIINKKNENWTNDIIDCTNDKLFFFSNLDYKRYSFERIQNRTFEKASCEKNLLEIFNEKIKSE